MNMVEAVKSVFSKYAVFSGRARRSEYWFFFLFNALIVSVSIVFMLLTAGIGNRRDISRIISLAAGIYFLATIIPGLAVCFRRLHDTDKSGAYILLCLTGIGIFLIVIWLTQDSDPKENEYGPNPKEIWRSNKKAGRFFQEAMIICPFCSGQNKADASVCTHCGRSLDAFHFAPKKKFCANCGAMIDKRASTCSYCGKNPDKKETMPSMTPGMHDGWFQI